MWLIFQGASRVSTVRHLRLEPPAGMGTLHAPFPHASPVLPLAGNCALIARRACTPPGFAAIYLNKERNGRAHFTSTHGQLGLAVTVLVSMQSLFSAGFLFQDFMVKKLGAKQVKTMKQVHRYASLLIYITAMAEVIISFYTGWWKDAVDAKMWMGATGLVLVTLVAVILQVATKSVPCFDSQNS